jgi:hypothetical protein
MSQHFLVFRGHDPVAALVIPDGVSWIPFLPGLAIGYAGPWVLEDDVPAFAWPLTWPEGESDFQNVRTGERITRDDLMTRETSMPSG